MELPRGSRHRFALRVDDGPPAPGMLTAGTHPDADVPFAPGEEFPFEDGSAGVLQLGRFVTDLPFASRVHLLLECRRVLGPNGLLQVDGSDAASAQTRELEALADLVGLDAIHGPHALPPGAAQCFTKPERRVHGTPLVSIAIPAYNPHFFATALGSAREQTYGAIEVIVCDDSEGPHIEAIAGASGDPRVRYERNPERLGTRGNFVRCFERASGEFVKFLCDDDVLMPDCVLRLVDAFRHAPDVSLATSARQRIDEHGAPLPDQPATLPILQDSALVAGPGLANAMLLAGLNTIGEPSTALFRRADFLAHAPAYFGFRGVAGYGIVDMIMWTRLLLRGNAVYLTERLSRFRWHAGQRQHVPATRERSIASIRALQAAWLELGLHERLAPDMLLAKPFPPREGDWEPRRITGFAARKI